MATSTFSFFEDDATGNLGVCHKECLDHDYSWKFNSFWTVRGIMHDATEHWFETKVPYFSGRFALEPYGEVAAMGALWYYAMTMGGDVYETIRPKSSVHPGTRQVVAHSLWGAFNDFSGSTFEVSVPRCRAVDDEDEPLREIAYLMAENISDIDFPEGTLESITPDKLLRYLRWGYKMASRLFPDSWAGIAAYSGLEGFITELCSYSAEDINYLFDEIYVKIATNRQGWPSVKVQARTTVQEKIVTLYRNKESYLLEQIDKISTLPYSFS